MVWNILADTPELFLFKRNFNFLSTITYKIEKLRGMHVPLPPFFFLFFFFSPVSAREEIKGVSCYQIKLTPGDGGQPFDDALQTSMWGRVFLRCQLAGLANSEKLFILLFQH